VRGSQRQRRDGSRSHDSGAMLMSYSASTAVCARALLARCAVGHLVSGCLLYAYMYAGRDEGG
jgi:hypothetical protein